MIIAAGLKQLFDRYKIAYRVLQHKRSTNVETTASLLNLDLAKFLAVQILADKHREVLVVYPVVRKLDLAKCQQLLQRDLQPLPSIKVNRIFSDCEEDSWPAVGQPYGIDIILDKSLKQLKHVYFASGSHTATVQMQMEDYLVLNPRAKFLDISAELEPESVGQEETDLPTDPNAIFANLNFPELPPVAMQILQLSMSKDHQTKELAELITNDPAMHEQIIFYTQLPFIQEKLKSSINVQPLDNIQNVVEHIVGFEMVSHLALSVAAGRAVSLHRGGNLEEFWRHAFYAATYAERITELVAETLELDPAISYMAGLFHNFGLLLFSQLFPPEYSLLKKWLMQNPKVSIAVLEKRLLGMGQAFNVLRGGHSQLGEWLLRSWQMPESICVITREHHSLTYKGKYYHYVRIIQLTNQLLRLEGIGDGSMGGIPEQLLEPLGLTIEQILISIAEVKAGAASLDRMAKALTNP